LSPAIFFNIIHLLLVIIALYQVANVFSMRRIMTKEKIKDAAYTRRYIYNFHYHLNCVTKHRNKTFTTDALANEMKEILSGIAEANKIVIENMEVMPDHVHMLISFPPSKAPTSAIKALKGRSAYMFLKRHPEIRQSQY